MLGLARPEDRKALSMPLVVVVFDLVMVGLAELEKSGPLICSLEC
jgi:hypothetical protein